MRAIKNNFRGVSNVIGALMLTLIVVGAATSFAIFVSQRQEMQQEAELSKVQKELENIDILNIEPSYNTSGLYALNFSIVNVNKDAVRVSGIWINKHSYYHRENNFTLIRGDGCMQNWSFDETGQLRGWSENCSSEWKDLTKIELAFDDTDGEVNNTVRLDLESYETVVFAFNDTEKQFYNFDVKQNEHITIKIYTSRGNVFEKTFYPPSAVIKIQVDSLPPTYDNYYLLDGSSSDHPGDGYILKWNWNVTNMTVPLTNLKTSGRIAQITDSAFISTGYAYWVNLTVTDNYGMNGKTSFYYDLT